MDVDDRDRLRGSDLSRGRPVGDRLEHGAFLRSQGRAPVPVLGVDVDGQSGGIAGAGEADRLAVDANDAAPDRLLREAGEAVIGAVRFAVGRRRAHQLSTGAAKGLAEAETCEPALVDHQTAGVGEDPGSGIEGGFTHRCVAIAAGAAIVSVE